MFMDMYDSMTKCYRGSEDALSVLEPVADPRNKSGHGTPIQFGYRLGPSPTKK